MDESNLSEPQRPAEGGGAPPLQKTAGSGGYDRNDGELTRAVRFAKEESIRLGHRFVGSEQLLVGILRQEKQVAAMILNSLGVSTEKARQVIKNIIGYGRGVNAESDLHLTALFETVLYGAIEEAKRQKSDQVRTQHILLAIVANEQGVALRVLETLNVDLNRLEFLLGEIEA